MGSVKSALPLSALRLFCVCRNNPRAEPMHGESLAFPYCPSAAGNTNELSAVSPARLSVAGEPPFAT
jgi:hypothetical protein